MMEFGVSVGEWAEVRREWRSGSAGRLEVNLHKIGEGAKGFRPCLSVRERMTP